MTSRKWAVGDAAVIGYPWEPHRAEHVTVTAVTATGRPRVGGRRFFANGELEGGGRGSLHRMAAWQEATARAALLGRLDALRERIPLAYDWLAMDEADRVAWERRVGGGE